MVKSISFLIPTYNDEKTITRVVDEAVRVGQNAAATLEIIVINDGSTDGTGAMVAKLASKNRTIKLITHQHNQGYGRTIKELYYRGKSDWLFTIPGDYQVGAKELVKLLPFTDQVDMIIGWRKKRHDPLARLVQSWFYNNLLNLWFGIHLHDVNSVRLMRRSILKKVRLTGSSAFVDAELTIGAKRASFQIFEVPIAHRASRKRGNGGSWSTVLGTIWEMACFHFR